MPRLRQVSRDEAEAPIVTVMYDFMFGDRDPVAEPGTSTGSPGDWWTVFALVPDVLEHAVAGFGLYRSPKRILDPVLRELGQTRAGWATGSQFVFSQHCKSLRGLGVSEEKIAAVPAWATSPAVATVVRVQATASCSRLGATTVASRLATSSTSSPTNRGTRRWPRRFSAT